MSQYVSARTSFNGLTRMDMEDYFDEMELENLYQWIDRIPLSRPKRNLAKDFSDGVLVAEMIKHYFPRMVELHSYTPALSSKQKMENWYLLNRRVLRKLDLDLSDDVIRALSNAKVKVIEKVLMMLRNQLDKAIDRTFAWKERAKVLTEGFTKGNYLYSPSPRGAQLAKYDDYLYLPSNAKQPTSPSRTGKSELSLWSWKPGPGAHLTQRPATLPIIPPPLDNVAKSLLDEKEMESLAKDETIRILNAKLKKLEHLIQLKDLRIDDLENTLNVKS